MPIDPFGQGEDPSRGSGSRGGEYAVDGIYELVSRRERPPGKFDDALDLFALTVETASAHLRAKWQEADYPCGLEEQEGVMLCASIEALGMLRARNSKAYTVVIHDLYQRDPMNEEVRLNYVEAIAEKAGEIASEVSIKTYDRAVRRGMKWMLLCLMLIALVSASDIMGGRYIAKMFNSDWKYLPSPVPMVAPLPPKGEGCL